MLSEESKLFSKYWIEERQKIFLKRKEGLEKPWTEDKIFQQKRFCNALRQLDKETKWLIDNWLEPLKNNENLYLAPFLFRYFNQGASFEDLEDKGISLITDYHNNKDKLANNLLKKEKLGERLFSPAYMITTFGKKTDKKFIFVIEEVIPGVISRKNEILEILKCNSFKKSFEEIKKLRINGFTGFILYQVILDYTYTRYLNSCDDNYEWTVIGPGAFRGLNRLFNRDHNFNLSVKQAESECKILMNEMNAIVDKTLFKKEFEILNKKDFNLHDAEFWCCELDKYLRAKYKQGNVKFYKN